MRIQHTSSRGVAGLALAAALSGCVSLSTFQSPRVLDPGETHVGAGVLLTGGDAGVGEMALIVRRGVSERVDLGARAWGFPPWLGVYGDVRYQLRREPLLMSATLGASFFSVRETLGDGEEVGASTTALYPTLLAGSERLFGGIRWTQVFGSAGDLEANYGLGFPGVVAGASFGSRLVLAPEMNVHFGEGTLVLPGIAVYYRF